jgi:hypothetical protein
MSVEHRQQAVTALAAITGASAPILFVDRISLAALWWVISAELVRESVGARLAASRSAPEQCEHGSGLCHIRSTGFESRHPHNDLWCEPCAMANCAERLQLVGLGRDAATPRLGRRRVLGPCRPFDSGTHWTAGPAACS